MSVLATMAALAVPSVAQAQTYTWATNAALGANSALKSPFDHPISGAYCHELDTAHTRNIEINATLPDGSLYGTWVVYQTAGLRSYAGAYSLHGACKNPHTVGYLFNAHVNYFV